MTHQTSSEVLHCIYSVDRPLQAGDIGDRVGTVLREGLPNGSCELAVGTDFDNEVDLLLWRAGTMKQ